MSIKVGINGFGRIGRVFMRAKMKYDKNNDIEVVGINDITDTKTLAHLLKYDSTFGVLEADIKAAEEAIVIDGKKIKATIIKDPCSSSMERTWSGCGNRINRCFYKKRGCGQTP